MAGVKTLLKEYVYKAYIFNMYVQDMALNNQQWLVRYQTQPKQTKQLSHFP